MGRRWMRVGFLEVPRLSTPWRRWVNRGYGKNWWLCSAFRKVQMDAAALLRVLFEIREPLGHLRIGHGATATQQSKRGQRRRSDAEPRTDRAVVSLLQGQELDRPLRRRLIETRPLHLPAVSSSRRLRRTMRAQAKQRTEQRQSERFTLNPFGKAGVVDEQWRFIALNQWRPCAHRPDSRTAAAYSLYI